MSPILLILTSLLLIFACTKLEIAKSPVDYVDPFIGTGEHGHTFPGAAFPFGMIQLSPDNGISGWDWCSGYHISADTIAGFSHTHLSGTGIGDLQDISVMPVCKELNLSVRDRKTFVRQYYSGFSHENEHAEPGYYHVVLDNKIDVELTVSQRLGLHNITYPENCPKHLMIDLGYSQNWDTPVDNMFQKLDDKTIVGYRFSKGWAADQKVYFVLQFSEPMISFQVLRNESFMNLVDTISGQRLVGIVSFSESSSRVIRIKAAISSASIEGALANLNAEKLGWDFKKWKENARLAWSKEFKKISVEGQVEKDKTIFYTAMYHTMIAPTLFSDVGATNYKLKDTVREATGFDMYTVFSLWDTFRAAHPLYTITQKDKVPDMINSMLAHYQENGLLPVWVLQGNETNCMIGYHAVPVIVDACLKGVGGFDAELAFEAMKASAMQNIRGTDHLRNYGYIPWNLQNESVSKTLEYCYDDWCIAQMAKFIGNESDYKLFMERAAYYRNLFDPTTGFMRGKDSSGEWKSPFDPLYANHRDDEYTEGNAWQYTWFVPHDVQGLVDLMGGKEAFTNKLDQLFSIDQDVKGDHASPDISGLIGQYAHGNEPSHHIAYLYNYVGQAWKCQEKVNEILRVMYDNDPEGICGNEDCGQMSAWYVLSSMGFYPVNAAEGVYVIGAPLFDKVTIPLDAGKEFVIEAKQLTKTNIYIQAVELNGESLKRSFIYHHEIEDGGKLIFEMGREPNKTLWTNKEAFPPSMSVR